MRGTQTIVKLKMFVILTLWAQNLHPQEILYFKHPLTYFCGFIISSPDYNQFAAHTLTQRSSSATKLLLQVWIVQKCKSPDWFSVLTWQLSRQNILARTKWQIIGQDSYPGGHWGQARHRKNLLFYKIPIATHKLL